MDIRELIEYVRARDGGMSYGEMVERARAAGFPHMNKSTLSRLSTQPVRDFPTYNMRALSAALAVPVLDIILACAESLGLVVWRPDDEATTDGEGCGTTVITTVEHTSAEVEAVRKRVHHIAVTWQISTGNVEITDGKPDALD
jgi:hypothetical protein